jgi:hypothetical protein
VRAFAHTIAAIATITCAFAQVACATNEDVAIVNSTERTLYVTINERAPFTVEAGNTVKTRLPALQQLTPVSITARDDRGATVYFQTTSVTRIIDDGRQVELRATSPLDPS